MLLLVDLDGVVYRGRAAVPGVPALLAARVARGDEVVYVTNNAYRHRDEYLARLGELGAPVSRDRIVTSASATAHHLAHGDPPARRVLVLGGEGLCRELREVGLEARRAEELVAAAAPGEDPLPLAGEPDVVVVGLDPALTYRSLALAADAIRAGARFVATNRDGSYPAEHGLRPGAGAIVAAVEATTGVVPLAIGKPSPLLLREAARAVGGDVARAVMIGDGIRTDMAAARAAGCRSVLMLTGVTSRAEADAIPAGERPTAVAADSAELGAALDRLAAAR